MTTTASTSRRSSSSASFAVRTAAGSLRIECSSRADGDFHRMSVPYAELDRRRRAFVDLPWTMLDEHHGTTVVHVDRPGAGDGRRGDVAVTDLDDVVLGCWVADCAPIVLVGSRRTFAVVHAGWRGLAAGVVDRAVEALAEPLAGAFLGPAIGPCCYEFGVDDLHAVAEGVGTHADEITSRTSAGGLALDIEAAVTSACARHGAAVQVIGTCTGCTYPGFSHRARRDSQRHVLAVWRPSSVA